MSYPGSHPYDSSTDPKNSNPNHSMFASQQQQQQHAQHSLYRTTSSRDPPQSWPPYDQTSLSPFDSQPFPYRSFPTPTPTPYTGTATTTTTTPCSPLPHNNGNTLGGGVPSASRLSIAGSFDPTTGIFCRMPEHPRLRTAQACEKCRMRKAKCSGEHPSCKRCLNRGLQCEYAKEGRVRGPNRAKSASVSSSKNNNNNTSVSAATAAGNVDPDQPSSITKNTANSVEQPQRPSSSSTKARDAHHVPPTEENSQKFPSGLETPRVPSPPTRLDDALVMSMSQNTSSSSRVNTLSQRLYSSSISAAPLGQASGLGHRRHSHPRPPNLGINPAHPWRQEPPPAAAVVHIGGGGSNNQTKWVDRSNVGLDLVVGSELGISQPQFGRQHLAKQQQQHGGYLLDEQHQHQHQQRHALQQHHGTLPHQHSAPSLLEYQQQQQPLSYPIFPATQQHQQQGTNGGGGINLYQSQQYSAYPSTMSRGYGNGNGNQGGGMGYLLSAMGQGTRSYRIGPSRREVTDLGLLPSLSRRAQQQQQQKGGGGGGDAVEQVVSEGLKEEVESVVFTDHHHHHQTSAAAAQDVEVGEGHGDQGVKWP